MTTLVAGLALWWVSHLVPVFAPGLRARAIERMGAGAWKALIALLSVAAIWLMVRGFRSAPFVEVWTPPGWAVHVNNLLMLVAVILLGAGHMKSPIARHLRHPMLAGVLLWAIAHLLVNGDLASIFLFAGMGLWALVAMAGLNARDGAWTPPATGGTRRLVIHLAASLVLYAVFILIHGPLLGVRPIPG